MINFGKTSSMNNQSFLFKGKVMIAIALVLAPVVKAASQDAVPLPHPDDQQLYIGDTIAIARTEYGKVQGFKIRNIYTFCGIPYGAPTSGSNRFMPPQPPKPWRGIRQAVFWGDSAPQDGPHYTNNFHAWQDRWNFFGISEDCLNLNVWTPGIDDGKKRPVLVWLHGGSWVTGNSIEEDSYKGENISRYGDIVYVSINHRVGPFGLINFADVDPAFKESGNISVLDMVFALQWVHRNIANFGGNPDNVTIMGQSGGGSKVCTLIAMPEIKGLVHKGVALSGSANRAGNPEIAAGFGSYIAKKTGKTMKELQEMPWRDFNTLAYKLTDEYNAEQQKLGRQRVGYHPEADGTHIPGGTFYQDKSLAGNNIPMIFCSTTSETSPAKSNAALENIDLDGAVKLVANRYGSRAQALVDGYHKAFPDRKPIELVGMIGWNTRGNTIAAANAKTRQDAPVWLAWFDWHPPLFDGRARSFHTSDICFWLRNTDYMLTHTGGGKRPRELSRKMADALLSFMRTGNPNCASIPYWHAYNQKDGWTMWLNDTCHVTKDLDKEARKAFTK